MACGIDGTDLKLLEGFGYTPDLPFIMGHEPAGIVDESMRSVPCGCGPRPSLKSKWIQQFCPGGQTALQETLNPPGGFGFGSNSIGPHSSVWSKQLHPSMTG